ncbi:MAG: zinc ribbon domain-containing protein [Deltaproteobacteria bacterium]|nr:zinc ribbon domain-containing protein [Deltaproteobacteria bacterium]
MASDQIVCSICGAQNEPKQNRCTSCGAKLDPLDGKSLTAEEQHARRHQQEGFHWKWVAVAVSIYLVLQGIALVALPFAIDAYEPEGLAALLISAGIWFVGGAFVGFISPGRTFLEPTVGALLAVVPTLLWIDHISIVDQLSLMAMIVGGMLGVMITLMGGFLGEKLQMKKE